MTVSDERLMHFVKLSKYQNPPTEEMDMAAELLRRRQADRWVPTNPEAQLCPEGKRLLNQWNKLRLKHNIYDCSVRPSDEFIRQVNILWSLYLDHLVACKECAKA